MTQSKQPRQSTQAERSDRIVKLGFLVATIVGAGMVYWFLQTDETFLKGWPADLDAALARAKETDGRVLALFAGNPPSTGAVSMSRTTLAKPQNKKAIADGKFIRVKVAADSPASDLSKRYGITKLPTTIIFDADGKELNRREGFVGEVAFRHGFLDMANIQTPTKP